MPKVSVIVPVYGVEKYIERCARSLFEQTLDDVEYIFIDDASPDNSISILKKVLLDYPARVHQTVIEKMPHNSGLAAVRKKGVQMATGDYLIACDSDDYVDKGMYLDMYSLAVANNYDLVHCDIDVVSDDRLIRTLTSPKSQLLSDELRKMIIEGDIANSLCNKLVKKEIYFENPISFPVAGMDEDNTLSCQLAYYSKRLGYINKSYYKAYQNTESMSRIPGEFQIFKRFEGALSNSKIAVDFLETHGYNEKSIAVIRAKIRPKLALWPLTRMRKYYKIWKDTFKETNFQVLLDKRVSFRIKVKFFLSISRTICLM